MVKSSDLIARVPYSMLTDLVAQHGASQQKGHGVSVRVAYGIGVRYGTNCVSEVFHCCFAWDRHVLIILAPTVKRLKKDAHVCLRPIPTSPLTRAHKAFILHIWLFP